jgi:ornithine cyclodeaminase
LSRDDILVVGARQVEAALHGREHEVVDAVRKAYEAHARGESSLPHSSFLRFPDSDEDRIISLPAYLGGSFRLAGLKWIASVPGNVKRGMERASAVVILNDRETGRPKAVLEGSIISKQRTAASAALAARVLSGGRAPAAIGFVGCGPINTAVAHFLSAVWPEVSSFFAFDLDEARAESFGERLLAGRRRAERAGARFRVAASLEEVLASSPLTAFATTAIRPYVHDLSACPPGATILHVSLRDLAPEAILAHHNVVDDLGHVCRAQTSIHLASEAVGHTDFVHGSLGAILLGHVEPPPRDEKVVVFSPFGLGILDLAVADLVLRVAVEKGEGTRIESFLP